MAKRAYMPLPLGSFPPRDPLGTKTPVHLNPDPPTWEETRYRYLQPVVIIGEWELYRPLDGTEYYKNSKTGLTQWDPPPGFVEGEEAATKIQSKVRDRQRAEREAAVRIQSRVRGNQEREDIKRNNAYNDAHLVGWLGGKRIRRKRRTRKSRRRKSKKSKRRSRTKHRKKRTKHRKSRKN